MHREPESKSPGLTPPLWAVAAFVGLYEATAIVRYDVLMQTLDLRSVLAGLAWFLTIVGFELVVWWGLRKALARLTPAAFGDRAVVLAFAAVAALARWLLDDRTIGWTWWLPVAAVLLAALPLPSSFRTGQLGLAAALVVTFSLFGRIPDFSFPVQDILIFLGSSAAVALVLLLALQRVPKIILGAALLLLALAPLIDGQRPVADGPNVLWILVDTARRDFVAPFSDGAESPAIERLAATGVRFDDAVTVVPKTPSSVASYFTGLYPIRHGVRGLYDHLTPTLSTAAEQMAGAGYETAAFVNNAWLSRGRGFAQGFRRFHGYHEVRAPYGPLRYLAWVAAADRLSLRRVGPFDGQTSSIELTDRVEGFLARDRKGPFFAYVHYFEPHWPYLPPSSWEERYDAPAAAEALVNRIQETDIGRGRMIFHNDLPDEENEAARALYRAEMGHTMEQIGRLVETLDGSGLGDDTIVVFSADHGHSLGEHRYHFHHGSFLYEASVRVPLILRWKGGLPAGVSVSTQVRSIDVLPTLLDLTGIRPDGPLDGVSLRTTWTTTSAASLPAFLESDEKMFESNTRRELPGVLGKLRGLRDGRYKLILTPLQRGPAIELYDLLADPEEERNLAGEPEHKETLDRMSAELAALIPPREMRQLSEAYLQQSSGDDRELDPNEERMLRSLGYIQ